MQAHTRALIAAAAYAFVTGKKVAGLYDHAAAKHLRIAAEARGDHLQGYDGDRDARFGGTLPELYDAADKAHISITITDTKARGHDRGSKTDFDAEVTDGRVQLYDHGAAAWFSFDVQVTDAVTR